MYDWPPPIPMPPVPPQPNPIYLQAAHVVDSNKVVSVVELKKPEIEDER